MNAYERYLAVFNENYRRNLDYVPTHVQYIKEEFIEQHRDKIFQNHLGYRFNHLYFDIPFILGFDSVFAPFPSSFKVKSIKVNDKNGKKIRIREDGQAIKRKSTYYEGGFIDDLETLNELWANLKRFDNTEQIKKQITYYNKISPFIFPILTVDGIFDRTWKSMGITSFSTNFRKNTKLYRELIKFYASLTRINIEGLIDATNGNGKVLNILDDIAFKGRTMISPERWEKDFLPLYKEINNILRDAGLITQLHTDGDPTDMIRLLQNAGFRGLQGWEGGCDPYYIREKFPDFVVIGFGDVSYILPYGTKKQIDSHVKELLNIFKDQKHFILGPSTVIFKEIPLENVKSFISAAKKYGKY
ncbi:MAG: uroporphyrinogen decarboxylase family protein [Candidatus Hodarchaeota archaeon]